MRSLILSALALVTLTAPTAESLSVSSALPVPTEGGSCVVTVLPGIGTAVRTKTGNVWIYNATTGVVKVTVEW